MLFSKLNCIVRYDEPLKNHNVLGVRAHFIEFVKSEENSFEVEIDQVIEDVFTFIILVRKKYIQSWDET